MKRKFNHRRHENGYSAPKAFTKKEEKDKPVIDRRYIPRVRDIGISQPPLAIARLDEQKED
jgi:hypothetical protein